MLLDQLIQKAKTISLKDKNQTNDLLKGFESYLEISANQNEEKATAHHFIGLMIFATYNFDLELKERAEKGEMNSKETSMVVQHLARAMSHFEKSITMKREYLDADSKEINKSQQAQKATGILMNWFAQRGPEITK